MKYISLGLFVILVTVVLSACNIIPGVCLVEASCIEGYIWDEEECDCVPNQVYEEDLIDVEELYCFYSKIGVDYCVENEETLDDIYIDTNTNEISLREYLDSRNYHSDVLAIPDIIHLEREATVIKEWKIQEEYTIELKDFGPSMADELWLTSIRIGNEYCMVNNIEYYQYGIDVNGIIIELRTYEGHLQRLGEPYYEELRLEIHKLFDCKEETQIINDEEYHTIYKDIELEVVARTVIPPIINFTPLTVEKIKEWSCNINETYMFIINNEILDFTEFREDYPNRQKSLGLYGINMSIFISSYRACSGVIIINEPWLEVPGVTEPDYEMIHNSSPDYELYYDKNRVYARMFNDEYTVLEYEGYHYIFDNAEYRGHFMFKIDGEMYTVEEVLNLELLSLLELYESHPFHIMRFRYEHK